jgi:hypothetical protein
MRRGYEGLAEIVNEFIQELVTPGYVQRGLSKRVYRATFLQIVPVKLMGQLWSFAVNEHGFFQGKADLEVSYCDLEFRLMV